MTDSPNEQPEPFDLNSDDVAARKRADLKRLFPEVFNEDKIDLDQLRRVMGNWVDEGSERFGLTWPGKAACMKVIQAPATGALRPDRDESVNFDESENIFIEGDNLEVLKLLQKAYFGKVRLIYIDPPYNTGGEFIYPDKFAENLDTYLSYTGQVDDEGRKFSTSTESDGRYHSRWLNMMMPRLFLAKNLLRDDGIIFVTIDDNEMHNLRHLMNHIFGEENFLANIVWKHTEQTKNDERFFARQHNSILCYRKTEALEGIKRPRTEEDNKFYSNPDNDPKGDWRSGDVRSPSLRPSLKFAVPTPSGGSIPPPDNGWRWKKEEIDRKIASGEIVFAEDETRIIRKIYLAQQEGRTVENVWAGKSFGTSRSANAQIKNIFDDDAVFDTPKPTSLISFMISLLDADDDHLIMDFFAGSGSTGVAVEEFNNENGTNHRFILVQLPEKTGEESLARKHGYETLSDLCRARLRMAEIDEGNDDRQITFRAFSLSKSNFGDWSVESTVDETDLLDKIEQASARAVSSDDAAILYELLLKDGFELTTKVDEVTAAGSKVYSVANGALLICLERNLSKEVIDALTDLAEETDAARIVCLDAGFQGNDQLKTNAVQTFKSRLGHGEDGSMFRTV